MISNHQAEPRAAPVTLPSRSEFTKALSSIPLVIWLIIASLVLMFSRGTGSTSAINGFNANFGRVLGEFALILLPAFVLASCLSGRKAKVASSAAAAASPFAAAAMVCPDTAYAALAPVAAQRKLSAAFGSYAGFKLLFPAGPLIVASGMGMVDMSLPFWGLVLLLPVWLTGELWARLFVKSETEDRFFVSWELLGLLGPFFIIFALIAAGFMADWSEWPAIEFVTSPKGALIVASCAALAQQSPGLWPAHLESAVKRTAFLLLLIGAASALAAAITDTFSVESWLPSTSGIGVIYIFVAAAAFKLVQGSSIATFAAVAPLVGHLLPSTNISPTAAVLATCLGSLFTIAPNDSYYWLVRSDALKSSNGPQSLLVLVGGSALQALAGLACLMLLTRLHLV